MEGRGRAEQRATRGPGGWLTAQTATAGKYWQPYRSSAKASSSRQWDKIPSATPSANVSIAFACSPASSHARTTDAKSAAFGRRPSHCICSRTASANCQSAVSALAISAALLGRALLVTQPPSSRSFHEGGRTCSWPLNDTASSISVNRTGDADVPGEAPATRPHRRSLQLKSRWRRPVRHRCCSSRLRALIS